jgi:hypothetical protein
LNVTTLAFRISGPVASIGDIQQLVTQFDGRCSAPQPAASSAEPLNAPISGGDVQAVVQVVTAVFSAGAAAAKFIEALLKLAQARKERIKASNVQTSVTRELKQQKDIDDLTG